tara:strand:- start:7276 stop:9228 length:1953 start_codon:yes stop_codon:yes gene_type:complete
MAKIFNVEQLRIGGHLLTGSNEGLFYDSDNNGVGERLAQGGQAVPTDREFTAGEGLAFDVGGTNYDTVDLTLSRTFNVLYDNSTVGINSWDQVYVKYQGITGGNLHANVPGLGLRIGNTAGAAGYDSIHVGDGSGLHVEGDYLNILNVSNDTAGNDSLRGIEGNMIKDDTISNRALKTISESNLVDGATRLHSQGGIEHVNNQGLNIENDAITNVRLNAEVAGVGLKLTDGDGIYVAGGSGVHVEGDFVNLDNHATLDAKRTIAGGAGSHDDYIKDYSIKQTKLEQLSSADKVAGSAVELVSDGGLADDTDTTDGGLYIVDNAIAANELNADAVAGRGLSGELGNGLIDVGGGSGLHVEGDFVNINEDGIVASMLADGIVGNVHINNSDKINGNKTNLIAGDGMVFNSSDTDGNTIDVGAGDGIVVNGTHVMVHSDVVRTTGVQEIDGEKSFTQIVDFLSGITVAGDLEVRGDTLVTENNEVNIGDSVIVLNAGYTLGSPPDAGIEVERGNSLSNGRIIFDDTDDVWKAGKKDAEGEILTSIRTSTDPYNTTDMVGSFFLSKQLPDSVTRESFLFSLHGDIGSSVALKSTPTVVVTLQNTANEDADLLGTIVTKVNTTGFNVDFSAMIPESETTNQTLSDYYIKAWVSTV